MYKTVNTVHIYYVKDLKDWAPPAVIQVRSLPDSDYYSEMKYARQRLHGIVVEIGYANTYEAQARSWAQGQPGIYIYIKFWASLRIKNRTDWSGFKGLEYKWNDLVWFLYPVLGKRD